MTAWAHFESSEACSENLFPPGLTVARAFVTPGEYEPALPVNIPTVSSYSASATVVDLEVYRNLATRAAPFAGFRSVHNRADRTKARFRLLRRLQRNHDGEGAAAADQESVDAAIAFLGTMQCSKPYFATLNDEGYAVIEFEDRDTGFFGDLTFQPGGIVQGYVHQPGESSLLLVQALGSSEMKEFLATHLDVVF